MRASHILWNFGGLALPLVVAFFAIPQLLAVIGQEKFGLLALAWGFIGYAGALDLGIGRALTQMVGVMRGQTQEDQIPVALYTANRITLMVGLIGGSLLGLAALLGGYSWIKVTTTSDTELMFSMLLLAVALPVQAMSATYRGVNEGFLNFRGVSLVRVALGVVNFGGPWLVSMYTVSLPAAVSTLVISRLLALFFYRKLAFDCIGQSRGARQATTFVPEIARRLFTFGKWVTISSVVSPVLVQADRFVIAAMLSAVAVTAYIVPYEVVTQSLIIVGAISSVIFPYLSQLMAAEGDSWRKYLKTWFNRVAVLMGLCSVVLAMLLPYILPWWIKEGFNSESILVGQILCLGVFFNALGSMCFAGLHAAGRADITAKFHLLELPFYLMVMVLLLNFYGLAGAAWAWALRMGVDFALLRNALRKL